jgi:hypothetical protein
MNTINTDLLLDLQVAVISPYFSLEKVTRVFNDSTQVLIEGYKYTLVIENAQDLELMTFSVYDADKFPIKNLSVSTLEVLRDWIVFNILIKLNKS